MSTNLEIIQDALRDINIISVTESASAEQGAKSLRKLNQMMELLKERDIDVGFFAQTSTTADCPIPDWAELPITSLLSVIIAPMFGATVSAELSTVITSTVNTLQRKMIAEKQVGADMTHMPIGQGWYGRGYDINTDA